MTKNKDIRNRNGLIDLVRGLNLISMIIFHAMWDIVYIFGVNIKWYKSGTLVEVWQCSIACTFVLLSGYCYRNSRHRLKNGIKVFVAGLIISLITYVFMPENLIMFGVLTMLGSCMLILNPLVKWLDKVGAIPGIIVSLVLFISTYNVGNGSISCMGLGSVNLPKSLYSNIFMTYMGFPSMEFYSADYFGIVPWIFLYIVGFYINKLVREIDKNKKWCCYIKEGANKLDKFRYIEWIRVIGRNSLVVYMLHQPIVYGILWIIFNC